MTTQNTNTNYFDLHTKGFGYLNRIREVQVRKGQPFMAVTIAALRGSSDDVEYTYFDCRVSGSEAEKLIRRSQPAVDAGKKVLVGFTIGDIYTETFTYAAGPKKGETGVTLKGRLLRISWIKVDGETVYQAAAETPEAEETKTADSQESAA